MEVVNIRILASGATCVFDREEREIKQKRVQLEALDR